MSGNDSRLACGLRSRQIESLTAMLRLHTEGEAGGRWKVLLYDEGAKAVLSTAVKVADLRKHGVTLFMSVEAARQVVPDVPAIYLLTPSPDAIKRITDDMHRKLYAEYYVSFTSPVPRPLLESLAENAVLSRSTDTVKQVWDENCHFVCFDDYTFETKTNHSFARLWGSVDEDMERCADEVASSLLCVFATLGVPPIIVCPPNSRAGMIANKLLKKLQDHLRMPNSQFSAGAGSANLHRPVLVLADRTTDMSIALSHGWTYRPLTHDLLGMKNNKIKLQEKSGPDGSKVFCALGDATSTGTGTVSFDLDPNDAVWSQFTEAAFQDVGEEIDSRLKAYKKDVEAVSRRNAEDVDQAQMATDASQLASAVEALPELSERKRILDMHTNIATALLSEINRRGIDQLYLTESSWSGAQSSTEFNAVLAAAAEDAVGTVMDKVRLCLSYLLSTPSLSAEEVSQIEGALQSLGYQGGAHLYVRYLRRMHGIPSTAASQTTAKKLAGKLSDRLGNLAEHMDAAGRLGMKMLQKIVPVERKSDIAKAAVSIATTGNLPKECEGWEILDAKQASGRGNLRPGAKDVCLFTVGGGNFAEFGQIMELVKKAPSSHRKSFLYGSTEMLSPEQFLEQMEIVAKQTAM